MLRQCTRVALRPFVLCARTRSALPHTVFPSELLRPAALFSTTPTHRSEVLSALASANASTLTTPASADPTPLASSASTIDAQDPTLLFSTLAPHLHPDTLRAITHTHMSPVQAHILPMLPTLALPHTAHPGASAAHPRDLLVKAKTGTGKTMAFLVPAIEARAKAVAAHLDQAEVDSGIGLSAFQRADAEVQYAREHVGCLIISPTRELASQIAVEASNVTAHHRGWQTQVLLGGESKRMQMRAWRGRKDIVVATPGRILDLLNSEPSVARAIANCNLLILDEADTLLDMGFRDDITQLIKFLPPAPARQTFLFSATVSRAIQQIAQQTLAPTHKFVNCVGADDSPVHAHIPQYHTVLERGDDVLPHVLRLIAADQLMFPGATRRGRPSKSAAPDAPKASKIIIFLSTTNMVQLFTHLLRKALYPPGQLGSRPGLFPTAPQHTALFEIHSKKDMSHRTRVSAQFRASACASSILVTSDVSARGVDYPGVTRVIQVGCPSGKDVYVHRVGRTGRGAAKVGRGDLVLADWEMGFLGLGGSSSRSGGRAGQPPSAGNLADVGLKPVTKEGVIAELTALGAAAPPSAQYTRAQIDELDRAAREIASSWASSPSPSSKDDTNFPAILSAFSSYAGFFLGKASSLGLSLPAVIDGLKRQFKEMWGLDREPYLGRNMEEMVRGALAGNAIRDRRGAGGFASKGYGDRGGDRGGYASRGSYGGGERNGYAGERGGYAARDRDNNRGSYTSGNRFPSSNSEEPSTFTAHHATPGGGYGFPRGARQGRAFSRAGEYARTREAAWESGGRGYVGRGSGGSGGGYASDSERGSEGGGYRGRREGGESESGGGYRGRRESSDGESTSGGGSAYGHAKPRNMDRVADFDFDFGRAGRAVGGFLGGDERAGRVQVTGGEGGRRVSGGGGDGLGLGSRAFSSCAGVRSSSSGGGSGFGVGTDSGSGLGSSASSSDASSSASNSNSTPNSTPSSNSNLSSSSNPTPPPSSNPTPNPTPPPSSNPTSTPSSSSNSTPPPNPTPTPTPNSSPTQPPTKPPSLISSLISAFPSFASPPAPPPPPSSSSHHHHTPRFSSASSSRRFPFSRHLEYRYKIKQQQQQKEIQKETQTQKGEGEERGEERVRVRERAKPGMYTAYLASTLGSPASSSSSSVGSGYTPGTSASTSTFNSNSNSNPNPTSTSHSASSYTHTPEYYDFYSDSDTPSDSDYTRSANRRIPRYSSSGYQFNFEDGPRVGEEARAVDGNNNHKNNNSSSSGGGGGGGVDGSSDDAAASKPSSTSTSTSTSNSTTSDATITTTTSSSSSAAAHTATARTDKATDRAGYRMSLIKASIARLKDRVRVSIGVRGGDADGSAVTSSLSARTSTPTASSVDEYTKPSSKSIRASPSFNDSVSSSSDTEPDTSLDTSFEIDTSPSHEFDLEDADAEERAAEARVAELLRTRARPVTVDDCTPAMIARLLADNPYHGRPAGRSSRASSRRKGPVTSRSRSRRLPAHPDPTTPASRAEAAALLRHLQTPDPELSYEAIGARIREVYGAFEVPRVEELVPAGVLAQMEREDERRRRREEGRDGGKGRKELREVRRLRGVYPWLFEDEPVRGMKEVREEVEVGVKAEAEAEAVNVDPPRTDANVDVRATDSARGRRGTQRSTTRTRTPSRDNDNDTDTDSYTPREYAARLPPPHIAGAATATVPAAFSSSSSSVTGPAASSSATSRTDSATSRMGSATRPAASATKPAASVTRPAASEDEDDSFSPSEYYSRFLPSRISRSTTSTSMTRAAPSSNSHSTQRDPNPHPTPEPLPSHPALPPLPPPVHTRTPTTHRPLSRGARNRERSQAHLPGGGARGVHNPLYVTGRGRSNPRRAAFEMGARMWAEEVARRGGAEGGGGDGECGEGGGKGSG